MKKMFQLPILIAIAILTANFCLAQPQRAELKKYVQESETVVEGEVFAQECFIDETSGNIRTANFVKAKTPIKGYAAETVVIYTNGGRIGDRVQTVSHSVKIRLGEEGIFLLQSGSPSTYNGNSAFVLKGGNTGLVKRLRKDREKEGYCPGTKEKITSWREIREQIGQWCGTDLTIKQFDGSVSPESVTQKELCVKLADAIPLFQTQQVQFDVYVKSSVQGLAFESIKLFLDYPTEHIDANIVTNGGISVTKQTVSSASIYQLSVQDVTESKLKVEIGTGCISSLSYYTLDTVYEKLARVVVDVSNWGSLGTLNLESFIVEGSAKYYEGAGRCYDFDRVCGEGEVGFAPCEVEGIAVAPFAAGIGQTLTITGQEFGNGILGEITIPDPDDGGATSFNINGGPLIQPQYFESWTNTEIKVKISSVGPTGPPFGSGIWEIDPDVTSQEPNTLVCFVKVEIDYALINENVNGVDRMIGLAQNSFSNPNGDLEWYLDAGINAYPALQAQNITFDDVEAVAIRAFCDWENAVGIETTYMGALNNPGIGDNRNAVFFANLDDSELGLTNVGFSTDLCNPDDLYFAGRIEESDIRLNLSKQWFVSTNTNGIGDLQYDLYSVLIHEIGHFLGHFHAMDTEDNGIDDERLMYYGLEKKQIKRDIDDNAENGIELLIQRTLESINSSGECFNGYVLDADPEGCPTTDVSSPEKIRCQIVLKNVIRKGDNIVVNLIDGQDKRLLLFNLLGQNVFTNYESEGVVNIPSNDLNSGTYFLQYYCNGEPEILKIVIQ
ncbi:MAG: T9SS type A sorting domain-containing protein [Saprospiraceae bacterium]|nr:T9SS type A sorting domain-containing protein [Saprospiraceae bacterium]MCF8252898.1 T9SS type A sorting domain-containing protein [Saprospiraceae bacterium]MCF8314442.1 T9SS type A sorting domain-containing protein [Saprospiraceae bacterium]